MYYALTINAQNIITGVHDSLEEILPGHFKVNPEYSEDMVLPITNPAQYIAGVDIHCYKEDGILQSEMWLIQNGYMKMPKQKNIVNNVLVDWYKVYVSTDASGLILAVSSDDLSESGGWTEIDGGIKDKYRFAEQQYFDKPLIVAGNVYRYRLINGIVTERTEEDIQAEIALIPSLPPTQDDVMTDLISLLILQGVIVNV